ncbi:MAG: hypothetical protein CMJ18_12375 [Phycisphaeraceae bacterium]|nr:hypothetical protein [Phycisphaeraceae bacterium]
MPSGHVESSDPIVGFMDIGTNSIRILVVRISPDGTYSILTEQKETARLGEGGFGRHVIQADALVRAVLIATRFADMARTFGADQIVAVATCAAREASNRRRLIDRLKRETDLDVRVISGREEARLIYLGVASDARLGADRALMIDIGGGSTELIIGNEYRHDMLESLKLGAIRMTNRYFKGKAADQVSRRKYETVRKQIRANGVRAIQRIGRHEYSRVIGSSGTITTLADMVSRRFHGRPLEKNQAIEHKQLQQVIHDLLPMTVTERVRIPGMSAKRGDIIVGGAAIIDTLLEALGGPPIVASDRTLRDGLLVDHLARIEHHGHGGELGPMSNRMRSVMRLGRRCRFDEAHARHVARLALELFDVTEQAGMHELGRSERELLEFAALLHDIGSFLGYSGHRSHSYYFIRNAELLGFDDTEIATIATTALYHKKTFPRKSDPEFAALDKRSQQIVKVLCVLLRVAESLDRSHAGVVSRIELRTDDPGHARLLMHADGASHLEQWSVAVHRKAIRNVFGVELSVELVEHPAAEPVAEVEG